LTPPLEASGAALVISCEHGGNRIPAPYAALFEPHRELLQTHRGYDPGALVMARSLARAFGAPLVAATVSRLLVDLNRSVGHPRLHVEAVRAAPAGLRRQIVERYHRPYREEAERLVMRGVAERGRVIHIASHSFTPVLDGEVRRTDVGLLYDPARPAEVALCRRWKVALADCAPQLTVRLNYPYAGKNDGLTRSFRRRLAPNVYAGIELELNQKHVAQPAPRWQALRAAIVGSLRRALDDPDYLIAAPPTLTSAGV
jgi:predicted N-formylglutamate amidohydrolase